MALTTKADKPRKAKNAATREAKGSVQEAIGKLIGDDVIREQGAAEKEAGAAEVSENQKCSRPSPRKPIRT